MEDSGSVQKSPVGALHPDILGEIFQHCDGIHKIYIEDPRPPLHYTLSEVCRKWHDTIQSCPSLWRKFGINFNDEVVENPENLEVLTRRLEICLKLSGALGLDLTLRCDASKLENAIPPFLEVAAHKLGEHSDRWVSLSTRPATPVFLSTFGTKAVKGIPRLEVLDLDFVGIEGPLEACLPWCDATKLSYISLAATTIDDRAQPQLKHIIPWWQITVLNLQQTSMPYRELRQLLDRTPNLRQLMVRAGKIEGVTKKITPVRLEYLTVLDFVPPISFDFSSPGSGLPQMFDLLDCPNLTFLSVWASPLTVFAPKGTTGQDILNFIHRTGCKLRAIEMAMARIGDFELLISEIPTLTFIGSTVDLKESFLKDLAKALTPSFTLDGMDIPAPNLRTIYLEGKVAGGLTDAGLAAYREGLDCLVEALEHRVKGSPSLSVYGYPPFQSLTLLEARHQFVGREMPKFDPKVYQPLLNFCRKHRIRTKVRVHAAGRGQFEDLGQGTVRSTIETDGYRAKADTDLFYCIID